MATATDKLASLSPAHQQVVQSTINTAKTNGSELGRILTNNDMDAAITAAVKLLTPLARDGVQLPENYASQTVENQLPSRGYYQLWLAITQELEKLEQHLLDMTDEATLAELAEELYERVQYEESILQRLYLMVIVGFWLVRTKRKPFWEIFEDLTEMSTAIQSSQRGLFLRAYILQKISFFIKQIEEFKNVIETKHFISIILLNFEEMNKLWVRMQYHGLRKDFDKRVQERNNIRMLIGKNLVYLSNLGDSRLTKELYCTEVLPALLNQAIASHDVVAQDYLFECIVQVYSDEFHLASQDTYIKHLCDTEPEVNVNTILSGFIERIQEQSLLQFKDSNDLEQLCSHFQNLCIQVRDFVVGRLEVINYTDILTIQASLLKYASKIIPHMPDQLALIDHHLKTTAQLLAQKHAFSKCKTTSLSNDDADQSDDGHSTSESLVFDENIVVPENIAMFGSIFSTSLIEFLKLVLDTYNDIHFVLKLGSFVKVYELLEGRSRRDFSKLVIRNIVDCNTLISDPLEADSVLSITIAPLLSSAANSEDQAQIGTLLNLLKSDDMMSQYYILQAARKHLEKANLATLGDSLPTLVFCALELVEKDHQMRNVDALIEDPEKNSDEFVQVGTDAQGLAISEQGSNACERPPEADKLRPASAEPPALPDIFREFIAPCINGLYNDEYIGNAGLALRLYLQAALACDRIRGAEGAKITYEFFSQALVIYEDVLPDSKTQAGTIPVFVGTVEKLRNLDNEEHEPLRSQIAQLAGRLFRKQDQVQCLLSTTHCFWSSQCNSDEPLHDSKMVCQLLAKALRVSCAIMEIKPRVECLLDVLHKALYYMKRDCANIDDCVSVLQKKIEENKQKGEFDGSYELTGKTHDLYNHLTTKLKELTT